MATTSAPDTATGSGGRLRAVAVAAAVIVAAFVLGIALSLVIVLGLPAFGVELSLTATTVLGLIALQGIAFPVTSLAYLRLRGSSFGSFIRLRFPSFREWLWIVGGYLLVMILVIAVIVIIVALDAPTASRADQQALRDTGTLVWLIPLSFLLIGPGEELLFRGVVQGRLRESFGPVGAVVLASAGFAPAHILALTGSVVQLAVSVAVLFVPALVFGAVYERTKNLTVPILIHGAYDATIFGIAYLALRYGTETATLLSPFVG